MLKLNLNSPVPIYEQLVQEIKRLIEQEKLKKGDSLPTIRSLASQLDVANNTVAHAYRELELIGLIQSNGRKGTLVTGKKIEDEEDDSRIFKNAIVKLLQKGLNKNDIEKIFESNISVFFD